MLAYYTAFHLLYFTLPPALLHDTIYPHAFGEPAAALIALLRPEEGVIAHANRLDSPRAALEIVRGCDGSGVLFLVGAAVLAFPASRRARAVGLVAGASVVYLLNVLRLVSLYFIAAYRRAWFLPLHTYFIPTLLIVLVALYYLLWLSRIAPTERGRR